ncbi:MAG: hypothetical protein IAF02_19080 [Anaerolineae bacterium]|nr:hypothetical protein [Anaerolineae bacterium]
MNELVERLNDFFAERPGLLPLIGVLLVILNLLLQIYPGPGSGWFVDSNFLLHIGVIMSIIGLLLVRALT